MRLVFYWVRILRQVLGDGEYERYRDHMLNKHPGAAPADPREFYVARLEEKYSRPQRCC
jgi:uncharacterized short protein YbdD (DUF466 family)